MVDIKLKFIVDGPERSVDTYTCCIVNGYKFKCYDIGEVASFDYGVMVKSSCYNNLWDAWYGRLLEVVVL